MRQSFLAVVASSMLVAACGGSSSLGDLTQSMNPVAPTVSGTTVVTGAWAGSIADSSGSMMGAGLTTAMMNGATWQLTQNGSTFSGTMQFPGYSGTMMVSGSMKGHTGTFTMTIPVGSMMMGSACTAAASGTFDLDDMLALMQGTYSGSNTCVGPFGSGHMTLSRR